MLPSFLTITGAGFAATVAQIVVLRELMVLFYGSEISTGLIFAAWLLWTALGSEISAKWSVRHPPRANLLGLLLSLLAFMLPVLVLFIRSSRILWSIPAGELPTLGKMILITVAVSGLLCPLSGALFGVCWAFHRQRVQTGERTQPLAIYMGEALGAAVGGLVFYYLFLPYLEAFTAALISSALLLGIARGVLSAGSRDLPGRRPVFVLWFGISLLVVFSAVFSAPLEINSRRWMWGRNFVVAKDTPYHNVAVVQTDRQTTVFTNGLWLFSEPDRLSAEHAVHLALLQHADPKEVLLLSGGMAGHGEEILKHPGIRRIDYVEPDPEFIPLIQTHLSPAAKKFLEDQRVHLHHEDAATFIRRRARKYDAILMNVGDPVTAQMNRFYTQEFFVHIKNRLLPGGVFSFAVSGGEDMMGSVQARLLSSIQKTLRRVFADVMVVPGNYSRFIAAGENGTLTPDVDRLIARMDDRKLNLSYIRQDTLMDALNPFRLGYVQSVLDGFPETSVNTDFSPICYYHTVMLWATQWQPLLKKTLTLFTAMDPWQIWTGFVLTGISILVFFRTGPLKFRSAVAFSVAVAGAMGMVMQLVLLLTFQILEGFVYLQLALIIAFFMTGLGVGAGWVSGWQQKKRTESWAVPQFIRVQAILTGFPLVLMLMFSLMHDEFRDFLTPAASGWIFSGLSLCAGLLGGSHFSLAVITRASREGSSVWIGGRLYALDLVGAAGGAVLASFFLLPVYGLNHLLALFSASSLISLLALLRRS